MPAEKYDAPSAAVFIQQLCRLHQPPQQYLTRRKDPGRPSRVYEVPERLNAVEDGVVVAYAKLEELLNTNSAHTSNQGNVREPFLLVNSKAEVDIQTCEDVLRVHGSEKGGRFVAEGSMIATLVDRCRKGYTANHWDNEELDNSKRVPDLALRPESLRAIGGATGTIREAVDTICKATRCHGEEPSGPLWNVKRAFVVIRPPGHHCDKNTPSGWCIVNNAVIAAAYAHRVYQIKRVVLFDIDLHHGFGTQRLVTQSAKDIGPRFFYGDLYDPNSWPCNTEIGEREVLTQQAISKSLGCISMEKVSLRTAQRDADPITTLFKAAKAAIRASGASDDVLVIISCGFGASQHEYRNLSAGKIELPTDFYYTFTQAACNFAKEFASGRLLSILEGGYSDKALRSGTLAHVSALALDGAEGPKSDWWSDSALMEMNSVRTVGQPGAGVLRRAREILSLLGKGQIDPGKEGPSPIIVPRLSQQHGLPTGAHRGAAQANPHPSMATRTRTGFIANGSATVQDSGPSAQQGTARPAQPAGSSSKRPRADENNEANSEAMKQPRLDKGKRRADAVEAIVISSDEEDDRPSREEFNRLKAQVARLERGERGYRGAGKS